MEKIRAGLMAELQGRRGMLCRVLRGGVVKQGDAFVLGAVT
jgi:MOSC domain-containing protein YiiM